MTAPNHARAQGVTAALAAQDFQRAIAREKTRRETRARILRARAQGVAADLPALPADAAVSTASDGLLPLRVDVKIRQRGNAHPVNITVSRLWSVVAVPDGPDAALFTRVHLNTKGGKARRARSVARALSRADIL